MNTTRNVDVFFFPWMSNNSEYAFLSFPFSHLFVVKLLAINKSIIYIETVEKNKQQEETVRFIEAHRLDRSNTSWNISNSNRTREFASHIDRLA